ncbi:MAG TPA: Uma2 family endonuclease [Verrucomicrobiae bacterium]|nr:Uma2 family endonuclease [Verrucomicrobiae bacterium]
MRDPYEEILEGEICLRLPPGERHEAICERLHTRVAGSLASLTCARLLPARSPVQLSRETKVRPDLALVAAASNKLWLVAEVVNSGDHNPDTVLKKTLYEQAHLPRLWMVDPRYNNVEVYHGSEHGMVLKQILAIREILSEPLLPKFQYVIEDLFKA